MFTAIGIRCSVESCWRFLRVVCPSYAYDGMMLKSFQIHHLFCFATTPGRHLRESFARKSEPQTDIRADKFTFTESPVHSVRRSFHARTDILLVEGENADGKASKALCSGTDIAEECGSIDSIVVKLPKSAIVCFAM